MSLQVTQLENVRLKGKTESCLILLPILLATKFNGPIMDALSSDFIELNRMEVASYYFKEGKPTSSNYYHTFSIYWERYTEQIGIKCLLRALF